jgi:F-type H+-transporting ATPase subunit epsilon
MKKQFVVKVYTPKGLVLEKSTVYIRLPGKSGDVGVFEGHTPSLIECIEGEMELKTPSHTHAFFLPQAVAHVGKQRVILLVNHLEPIENIDKKRAEESKERALARLKQAEMDQSSDVDTARAKESLNRAELRLEILLKHHLD